MEKDEPFLMVMKEKQIVDISLMRDDKSTGHFTPVVDLKQGVSVDYDTKEQVIYWTEIHWQNSTNSAKYVFHSLSYGKQFLT